MIAGQNFKVSGSDAMDTNGGPFLWVTDAASVPHTDTWMVQLDGSVGDVIVKSTGHMFVTTHAAPADADISAGECALWFDQTNGVGATKLMVKGKSADGTVKAAT